MKKIPLILHAIAAGLLLWAAWPVSPLTFLIFAGFVPLLYLAAETKKPMAFFGMTYLAMLIWNALTTWWIWNSTAPGSVGAIMVNSLIMCAPWLLYRTIRQKLGSQLGYVGLVTLWLSFEYLHMNWELSWPWLTLGNAFAMQPNWVQWYEYTGTGGGSLWVLVANILAYECLKTDAPTGASRFKSLLKKAVPLALVILLPLVISLAFQSPKKESQAISLRNVVVVQPNIDPYLEKFAAGRQEAQIQKLIQLSEKEIDTNTRLVIWPETAVPVQILEDQIQTNYFYNPIRSFLARHPRLSLLTGIDSYRNYGNNKNASPTARRNPNDGSFYDAFNTAIMADSAFRLQWYHKSKLVPGVESLPSWLNFIGDWFEDFGGISGTLGRQKERSVFTATDPYFKAAPIICYESIYGEYVTDYVKKGANILTVITNDGWWGETAGHRQHLSYARLRAIETRCWVARSANTGISCFIDPMGNIHQPQPWNRAAAIKMAVSANNQPGFYVKNGDLLSRGATILAAILLGWLMAIWIKTKFGQPKTAKK